MCKHILLIHASHISGKLGKKVVTLAAFRKGNYTGEKLLDSSSNFYILEGSREELRNWFPASSGSQSSIPCIPLEWPYQSNLHPQ